MFILLFLKLGITIRGHNILPYTLHSMLTKESHGQTIAGNIRGKCWVTDNRGW